MCLHPKTQEIENHSSCYRGRIDATICTICTTILKLTIIR
jgi:hypothetical protein